MLTDEEHLIHDTAKRTVTFLKDRGGVPSAEETAAVLSLLEIQTALIDRLTAALAVNKEALANVIEPFLSAWARKGAHIECAAAIIAAFPGLSCREPEKEEIERFFPDYM